MLPVLEFIASDNENPPQVDSAPEGPYLKERMNADHNWIVGLGNDELGYIIPEYNFELDDRIPYIDEAEGDHYEETNSLGPRTIGLLYDATRDLADVFQERVDEAAAPADEE